LISVGKRFEERRLRRVDIGVQQGQRGRSGRRQLDEVAPTVVRVTDAGKVTGVLELVQQRVEIAAIDPQPPTQLGLAGGRVAAQLIWKDGELPTPPRQAA
jgi:hypothetical protein